MRVLVNVFLVLASLLLCLFLGEWVFTWLEFPVELPVRAAHPSNYVETRESIEFRYRFATNSGGLRYREIPRERPSHGHRVLVLGDSYVEGLGVEAHDRFTNRLELDFAMAGQELSFINGGLSGTGPSYYARLLKYIGLSYEPDGVMVCVFANDVANTHEDPTRNSIDPAPRSTTGVRRVASRWWPRIYTMLGTLKERWQHRRRTRTFDFENDVSSRARQQGMTETRIEAWINSLPPEVVDAINANRFGFGVLAYGLLYPKFWTDSLDLSSHRSEAKWKNMVGSLDSIVSLAARDGIEVAVVYLPVHFQYDLASHQPDNLAVHTGTIVRRAWLTGKSEVESRLERWAAQRRIPFLSLTEAFRAAVSPKRRLNYELDGHWTPAGHEVAANALARWLRGEAVFSAIAPTNAASPQ